MAKVAVILSGCGVFDGSEVYESVLTLLALEEQGAEYQCFAPDIKQHHVVNHITGEEMEGFRNVLIESARICRGKVEPIDKLRSFQFDALIFPGGFGVAKNLSNFALQGAQCEIETSVLIAAKSFVSANKPIGFICIAPALIPLIYGKPVELTIGNDLETAQTIEAMGSTHIQCPVTNIVVDKTNKVVSTPAYMLANNISESANGIRKLVNKILELC
ncbi:isoprenoid biosynthesis glyoxalase ElbB [Aliikangiella sp. IMCC44359]|uniref:isoprenoid biosynthesis glyoxalase ElbB n=1 Tax=Aliikangiella sp. IMCC44359 TaxID=3459125 RepID=UPI00403A9F4D